MGMFEDRSVKPMLLTERRAPEPGDEWLNELKLDGIRTIAYLDKHETDLRNKRGMLLLLPFPELAELHRSVRSRCILDGELIISGAQGKPDFETLQARSMSTDRARIRFLSQKSPASFVAFDIVYLDGEDLTAKPLVERKRILSETIVECDRLALSRAMEGSAEALFRLTTQQGLEGIVQKRKDSRYQQGKRSHDWVKVKNLIDEEFLACGYIQKAENVVSIVLGLLLNGALVYQGHVTLGVSAHTAQSYPTASRCPFAEIPEHHEAALWYAAPLPTCTVTYMERTSAGGMRQPRFKGFRAD